MNIGITSFFKKEGDSIWKNGISQNVLMLADLLSSIDSYKVSILNIGEASISDIRKIPFIENYNIDILDISTIDRIKNQYNLIITLGGMPSDNLLNIFKSNKDNRIVFYKGGNDFVNQIETILYGQYRGWDYIKMKDKKLNFSSLCDEVWFVPQQEFHNKDYYEIVYDSKSRVVPFVWSPSFLEKSHKLINKELDNTPYFDDKNFENWRFVSFEPNMSILKNMMPIIYYMNYSYKNLKNKDLIEKLIITNSKGHKENTDLIHAVKDLMLFKDKKISFDNRYPIVYVLSKFSEAVVSHQWGNALNYTYLDASYFGIPLVHNANLCKDLGYYYEDWKLKEASKQVLKVIDERKSDKSYTERQRKILYRYTKKNKDMVDQYKILIDNLWSDNIGNNIYNSKENLISW